MSASAAPRGAAGPCRAPGPGVGSPAWLPVCCCVLERRAPRHLLTSCPGGRRAAWEDEGTGESGRREERSPWHNVYDNVREVAGSIGVSTFDSDVYRSNWPEHLEACE